MGEQDVSTTQGSLSTAYSEHRNYEPLSNHEREALSEYGLIVQCGVQGSPSAGLTRCGVYCLCVCCLRLPVKRGGKVGHAKAARGYLVTQSSYSITSSHAKFAAYLHGEG